MLVRFCDLCHKEIPDSIVTKLKHKVHYSELYFFDYGKTEETEIEMCPKCTESFAIWVECKQKPRGDME